MKRGLLVGVASALVLLALPIPAHADVNNFTVTNFHADENLSRSDPQGELHVTETINVYFSDYNHGIVRAVPDSYKGNSLQFHLNSISSTTGAPTAAQLSNSSGNVSLRIGDASRTVTGAQEYTIDYTLKNVISFYKDHSELYWDVNGDQWSQPFDSVSVSLHVPDSSLLASKPPQCYSGGYGSTEQNCTISDSGDLIQASASSLAPGQTLTYVAAFRPGVFVPMTLWQKFVDHAAAILSFALPVLLGLIVGLVWWLKSGRDAKGKGTIIPQYSPPQGITPLAAGAIIDFKVDNRDITATIIDLARRGYLTINEVRKDRKLLPDTITYTLIRGNADLAGLNNYEVQLLAALFTNLPTGSPVSLTDSKNKLYQTAGTIRKSQAKELVKQGYFKSNPTKYGLGLAVFLVPIYIGFHGLSAFGGTPLIAGLLVGGLIFMLFYRQMAARTSLGVTAKDELLGLKMYMETAEKDRMAMLESAGAAYAANAGAPVRTVELFEKLLPYAIVLGVEKTWAAEFNNIYTQPPSWYAGNMAAFNAGYLVGSLNGGFSQAVGSSFTSPTSSGSSGFGGGGFSGGGGGGGGGGGW